MCEPKVWISPDNRIKKDIIKSGVFGAKPTENCICKIEITNVECIRGTVNSAYTSSKDALVTVNIGDSNTALDREIDKCLMTMHREETSNFVLNHGEGRANLTLALRDFEFRGYIYGWDAQEKLLIALAHKEKGVELFKQGRYVDASHRFSRGLKLLLSVPESVEVMPEEDDVEFIELYNSRANLYNNLASCYLKVKNCGVVISLCTKVLQIEKNNLKALHKRGIAYCDNHNFEGAKCDFVRILELDPHNKAAQEKLQFVNSNLSKQDASYASIVKKMFAK